MTKIKSYNFREFMQGTHELPKLEPKGVKLNSSLLPVGVGYIIKVMFFNEGVMIVGTMGALCIALAYMENRLAKKGDAVRADRVAMFGFITVRVIGYGAVLYFLGHLFATFGVGL